MSYSADPIDSSGCVLLFSGGRDSTIAAVRLGAAFSPLVLLTVTSSHLIGIDRVRRRLAELRPHLPLKTEWVHVVSTAGVLPLETTNAESCLPCQNIYFLAATHIADQRHIANIATGYTRYQSAWLEQSPQAIDWLRNALEKVGKGLVLPSQDVASKHEADSILISHGLSDGALEQKCLKQQFNTKDVSPDLASKEIDNWGRNLERILKLENALDFLEVRCSMSIEEFAA